MKKWIIAACFVAALFLIPAKTARAEICPVPEDVINFFQTEYAESNSLYLDGNDTLWFITDDAERASSIFYRTKGFRITRCVAGTKTPVEEEYIEISVDNPFWENYYHTTQNRVTAYFPFDQSEILSKVRMVSEDWYNDIIKGEQTIYLKFDGIMTVCREVTFGEETQILEGGKLKDTVGRPLCEHIINPNPWGYKLYYTARELRDAVSWGAGTNGIESHFNKYFCYRKSGFGENPNEDTPGRDADFTGEPKFYTWNKSELDGVEPVYNLKEGIPTSEVITNYIECDSWIGAYTFGTMKVSANYTVTCNFEYTNVYIRDTSLGLEYKQSPIRMSKKYTVTKEAFYHYISDLQLFDYYAAQTFNGTYNSAGKLTYRDTENLTWDVRVYGDTGEISLVVNQSYDLGSAQTKEQIKQHTDFGNLNYSYTKSITKYFYGRSREELLYAVNEDYKKRNVEAEAKAMIPDIKVRDDYVSVDGNVYMTNEWHVTKDHNDHVPELFYSFSAPAIKKSYAFQSIVIDKTVKNGTYPTYMEVAYKCVYPDTSRVYSYKCKESDKYHIKDMTQEPILVHTPVIAPVRIVKDSKEDCQLKDPNKNNLYVLLLDGTYELEFEPGTHLDLQGYGYSDNPSKYDKYTSLKAVRFPFEVRIGNEYIEPNTWTIIGNKTTFWIPTWAKEGGTYSIDVRVVAENFDGDYRYDSPEEDYANFDIDKYVATYSISCSVSGQIYNFTVTGISDPMLFYWSSNRMYMTDENGNRVRTPEYEAFIGLGMDFRTRNHSFWMNDEPKRAGANNRFGNPYVRLKDGTFIAQWSPIDSLPLRQGSSRAWPLNHIPTGERFGFTVNTIGRYEDDDCEIKIIPTYRYVAMDGTLYDTDEIQIYYMLGDDFIKFGSPYDLKTTNKSSVRGDNTRFDGAITDYMIEWKSDWYNRNNYFCTEYFLETRKWAVDCASQARMPFIMSFFMGTEEELQVNQGKTSDEINALVLTPEKQELFYKSMQKWTGEYTVPNDMYVCPASVDIQELSDNWSLSTDSDCWFTDGYLILNFKIIAVQDGKEYLLYNNAANGMCNMWKKEGMNTPKVTMTFLDVETEITLRYGDVMIVDLAEEDRRSARYQAEYLFIN